MSKISAPDFMLFDDKEKRLSYRLAKMSAGFDSRYYPFFYDPFGFLDAKKVFELPKHTDIELLDACLERARELSGCNLMFSGGVDSTFLLACFKSVGADVRLVNYCPEKVSIIPELKKYIDKNFDVNYVSEKAGVSKFCNVYMGSLSDSLFFSRHRLKEERTCERFVSETGDVDFSYTFVDTPYISLADRMLHKFRYDDIELVLSYAALLDVPLKTNKQIARFIDWVTCLPKYMCQASWGYFVGMDSFFNKPVFFDIAYSQYWDSNEKEYHDKKLYREFISDVLGSDFGVKKNYT